MNRFMATKLVAASAALAAAIFAGAGGNAAASENGFQDIDSHWARASIQWAENLGIVDGYDDGTFRPDGKVTEPEFLAMLVRANPEAGAGSQAKPGEAWYEGYYSLAQLRNWSVLHDAAGDSFNRGQVAKLIASTQGKQLGLNDSIQYLLDQGLSGGKTSATITGFGAADSLTRGEAVQFLHNAKDHGLRLAAVSAAPAASVAPAVSVAPAATVVPAASTGPAASAAPAGTRKQAQEKDLEVRGVGVGDTEASVVSQLGQPDRKDLSRYGFEWYVYNQDLTQYAQIGIQDGKVVGLYTSGTDWRATDKVQPAMDRTDVVAGLGNALTSIKKGNAQFMQQKDGKTGVYELDGAYVTFFYDLYDGNKINGIQAVKKETEQALVSFYGQSGDRLRESYEREIFDLANSARAQRGLPIMAWNDKVAAVSRGHSEDMAARNFFDHVNPDGLMPSGRAAVQGLFYQLYAENIAAGQQDAFGAYHSWMNSEGHRENLLRPEAKELGTGVAFGGSMHVYYTQNFYTAY